MLQKASELRLLDVINISDGRRLGNVYDLDMDLATGEIKALIVPGPGGGWFGTKRGAEIIIHWDQIVRIGKDVILVDLPPSTGSYGP
ncbi:MAG TPA: YlmC/YmxH family sporulation protein [Firmicutes bacterium]|nr:YlmC/YmxH family sporulation protein [Bacillota bacterium]